MLRNKRAAKALLLTACAVLVLAALSGCGKKNAQEAAGKQVVAQYKGGQITQAEFDRFTSINKFLYPQYAAMLSDPGFQDQMLDQLIAFKILGARADDKTKKDADAKAKDQMNQIAQLYEAQYGKGSLDKQLKDQNLTRADLEKYIKDSAYAYDAIESKIDDNQVKTEFDKKLKADPNAFDVATVSHILIGLQDPNTGQDLRTKEQALARANEVEGKLQSGGDFAALAKEYSDDPGSKDNGGKYADAPVSQWDPDFKKAVVSLPLNKISDPVLTQFGYHIIKVESRTTKTFDEMKEQLKSELAQNQIYDFMDKELPGLIQSKNLPKPPAGDNPQTPAPPASGATEPGTGSGSAPSGAAPGTPEAGSNSQPSGQQQTGK